MSCVATMRAGCLRGMAMGEKASCQWATWFSWTRTHRRTPSIYYAYCLCLMKVASFVLFDPLKSWRRGSGWSNRKNSLLTLIYDNRFINNIHSFESMLMFVKYPGLREIYRNLGVKISISYVILVLNPHFIQMKALQCHLTRVPISLANHRQLVERGAKMVLAMECAMDKNLVGPTLSI